MNNYDAVTKNLAILGLREYMGRVDKNQGDKAAQYISAVQGGNLREDYIQELAKCGQALLVKDAQVDPQQVRDAQEEALSLIESIVS